MIELIDPYGLKTTPGIRVIRQSMLGTADVCLKRLEYDLTAGESNSTYTVKGTAFHAGCEQWYSCWPDVYIGDCIELAGQIFDAEVEYYGNDIDWSMQDRESCWIDVQEALITYLSNNTWDLNEWRVVGTEIEFWMPLFAPNTGEAREWWKLKWAAKGTIDLILQNKINPLHFVVVDHKTTGKPWKASRSSARHNNQPAWYLHWIPILLGEAKVIEEVGQLDFYFDVSCFDGTFKRIWAPRSQNEIATTLFKAHQLAELLELGAPLMPNTASSLCSHKWCRWWETCPWGESFRTEVLSTNQGVTQ